MEKKQVAVIGIGRFGSSLVKELSAMGHEVLAIDAHESRVNDMIDIATQAVEANSMDENVLKSLGLAEFDVVVVAIGENLQANVLTTIMLKEMGVKKIVAKAQNELHGRVLEKLGADLVVYPERDMAVRVAHALTSNSVLEYISLSSNYSIVEMTTPRVFEGKTLAEMDLRSKYQVNIMAIKRGEDIIVAPGPREKIAAGDLLVMIGTTCDLENLGKLIDE
ncbi:MAG: TrkA family potassium uptake protein [Syntrophomonadaceae bacterium]